MQFKLQVYACFQQMLADKISMLQHTLGSLRESAANETKSSAGDKYETARAMLHNEQQNVQQQLSGAGEQQHIFNKININEPSVSVILGSLVETNRGWFFISVALGKAVVQGQPVIAVSAGSPLGAKLLGIAEGDTITINAVLYKVLHIY